MSEPEPLDIYGVVHRMAVTYLDSRDYVAHIDIFPQGSANLTVAEARDIAAKLLEFADYADGLI